MGADWFDLNVFFGLVFPLDKAKALKKAIKKKQISLGKYEFLLVELETHSRTEFEGFEDTLDRCEGCVGLMMDCLAPEDVHGLMVEFADFMKKNKEKLNKCGIETLPTICAGIEQDVDWIDEFRDVAEDSPSEDEVEGDEGDVDDQDDDEDDDDDDDGPEMKKSK